MREITPKNAISILNSARPRKGSYDRLQVAFSMAVKALEKQIPKKVIRIKGDIYAKTKDGKEAYVYENKCPSCGSIETIKGYPCRCGQKLDWEEEK